ncbi:hypothetical protein QLX67_04865, partial [Balneolaceae bacterium ANBcel3]|nr:hypothetical protein [Balneolaceae bacterium ANBcel3]
MISISNQIKEKTHIGVILAENIQMGVSSGLLSKEREHILALRSQPLAEHEDQFRKACRDMLR